MLSNPGLRKHAILFLPAFVVVLCFSGASAEEQPKTPAVYRPSAVKSLAFTLDGKQILSAGLDGTITLWNVREGSIDLARSLVSPPPPENPSKRVLVDTKKGYVTIAIAPTGKFFAAAGCAGAIELWNLDGTQPNAVLQGHTGKINTVAVSGDAKSLASAGDDGTVRLWDVGKAKQTAVLNDLAPPTLSVAWSPDGKLVAAANATQQVMVWDVVTGEVRHRFTPLPLDPKASSASLAFQPRGEVVAVGYLDDDGQQTGLIAVHYLTLPPELAEAKTFSRRLKLKKPGMGVMSAMFTPQGQQLITLLADSTVCFWDAAGWEWEVKKAWNLGEQFPSSAMLAAALSPNGTRLGIGGASLVNVVDPKSGTKHLISEATVITIQLAGGKDNK